MAETSTLSLRVDQEVIDGLDRLAADSPVSRSKVAREALLKGLASMEEIPDHLTHMAETKRTIASNKAERRRGKFRREFSNELQSSFERGEHPDEFRASVSGYIEEAERMGELPDGVQEETGCTTYIEWVRDKLAYYRAAYDAQQWDHDPTDDPLGQHEGVQDAKEWAERASEIADTWRDGHKTDARRKAQYAKQDGIVPDEVAERVENGDGIAPVVDAATELVDSPNLTAVDSGETNE